MAPFPKLTEAQRIPLLALADYQKQCKSEVVFALSPGWEKKITPIGQDEPVVSTVPPELVTLWEERGYVLLGGRNAGHYYQDTLILCEEALDLEERARKGWLAQLALNVLDTWATDLRTAILAIITAVLTTLLLNVLGLLD